MPTRKLTKKYVRDPVHRVSEYLRLSQNTYLFALALVTGLLCGFGSVGVRWLLGWFTSLFIGSPGEEVLETLRSMPAWQLMLLPAAGGLIIGPLIRVFSRESSGHGVPEVMEAVALHGGRIRPRVVWMKALTSTICIGSGGSAGPEGPIVQIGSAIGSTVGQVLRVNQDQMRLLVACGAASGLAATFNAPIGGVLFAIEVILGSYAMSTLTPLILASVAGTFVAHSFPGITGGDAPIFLIPQKFELVSAVEIPLYVLLGFACAATALAFVKVLYFTEGAFQRMPLPSWIKPAIGGLAVGAMLPTLITFTGDGFVYGTGYEATKMAITGSIPWAVLLALVLAKIVSTSFTLGSGGSGGVFAPALFLGAMTGGAFGCLVHWLLPSATAQPGAYAVVGMGGVLAATMHAPITAILIIFEMTGDYSIILPIMAASIVAGMTASRFKKESIYTEKLARKGVNLDQGFETTIIGSAKVRDVMSEDAPVVSAQDTLNHMLKHFLEHRVVQVYVLDETKDLKGIVHISDAISLISESGLQKAFIASDVMDARFPSLSADESLTGAFGKFGTCNLEELPVLEQTQWGRRFAGVVTRRALFMYYNREVLRQNALGLKFVHRETDGESKDYIWMPPDHEVKVLPVPYGMAGKTLKDLDLRSRFGVNVVAIRGGRYDSGRDSDVPSPDRVLRSSETLVVVGSHEDIARMLGEGDRASDA